MTTRFFHAALLIAVFSLAGASNAQPLPSDAKASLTSSIRCVWVVTPDGAYISCRR